MISGQEIHWKFSGFSNKSNIFFMPLHFHIWIFHRTKSVVHPKRFPDTQYYFPGPLLSANTRPWPIEVCSEKPHNYEKMPENFIRTHACYNTPSEYKDTIPLESLTKKNSFFNGKIQILESVTAENHWIFSGFLLRYQEWLRSSKHSPKVYVQLVNHSHNQK